MKGKTETTRLNINIPTEQHARLEKLSELTDRPVTAMVRRALAAYLDEEEAALRKRK
jgi:predicted DNA-binding protein